jgi:hypothetical protein
VVTPSILMTYVPYVAEEMKYEDITGHTKNIYEVCSVCCLSIYGHV